MLVFRVELKCSLLVSGINPITQAGPYGNSGGHMAKLENPDWFYDNNINTDPCLYNSDIRHPSPRSDSMLKFNPGMKDNGRFKIPKNGLFCFSTIPDLMRWFNEEERGTLRSCGFICVAYEAETVYEGHRQSVFLKETAAPVDFIDLFDVADFDNSFEFPDWLK